LFVEGNKIGLLGKHRSVEICHLESDWAARNFPLAATPSRESPYLQKSLNGAALNCV
jgi:hypothetical protein